VNVSLFAVGYCCRHAAKGVADGRQSLSPPRLGNLSAHRKTRNRAALAPSGVADLLAQQLLVLQRRKPRPRFTDADRRFWILAYRWFVAQRNLPRSSGS
jgi:hypothetical protein